jgi:hypothetical protein
MWEDDKDISKDVTFRAGSTNVTIAGNKLTYDKVIDNEKLKVTVTGTYNNNAASTEIEL